MPSIFQKRYTTSMEPCLLLTIVWPRLTGIRSPSKGPPIKSPHNIDMFQVPRTSYGRQAIITHDLFRSPIHLLPGVFLMALGASDGPRLLGYLVYRIVPVHPFGPKKMTTQRQKASLDAKQKKTSEANPTGTNPYHPSHDQAPHDSRAPIPPMAAKASRTTVRKPMSSNFMSLSSTVLFGKERVPPFPN